jgi:hypothetical protein
VLSNCHRVLQKRQAEPSGLLWPRLVPVPLTFSEILPHRMLARFLRVSGTACLITSSALLLRIGDGGNSRQLHVR